MADKYITIKIFRETKGVLDVLAALHQESVAELIDRFAQAMIDAPLTDPKMIELVARVTARNDVKLRQRMSEGDTPNDADH